MGTSRRLAWLMLAPLFAGMAQEHGKLLLFFLQNPVGEETYELDAGHTLHSDFGYTERGSKIALTATLRMKADLTPERFEAKGKSYRPFSVDAAFEASADEHTARVSEAGKARQTTLPAKFFTVEGYAPFSVQMMLLRYWDSHGKPARLTTFPAEAPGTEATVEVTGQERVGGSRLTRYSIGGIVWGRESIWLDERGAIAAGVSYAGGLPLEAVRPEFRVALPQFVRSAVADRMKELAADSARVRVLAQGELAITGATLIDGTGAAPVPDAVVVIRNGRIVAAGPRAQVAIPPGAARIDGRGSSLLPGLWEMHAHLAQVEYGPAYLAAGVTTARDCGEEFEFITAARDLINRGRGLGPQLVLAGLVDRSGEGSFGVNYADTPEQGRAMVARYKAAGFAQMKIYSRIQPDVLRAITAEAHRVGMTVTGHVPDGMTARQAVEAGMDQINHLGPVYQEMRRGGAEAVQFFVQHGTVVDPTMSWNELLGRAPTTEIASFEPGFARAPYTLTSLINSASGRGASNRDQLAAIHTLYEAGVPIVAGTDKAVPAHSLHRELELYVDAGISAMDVIRLATSGAAKVMGMAGEVGTVEAGKRADLILVEGNPLEHFSDLRRVTRVVRQGKMYDTGELWKMAGFR
jgi:imidazolonepropionase-like amidohydrolase